MESLSKLGYCRIISQNLLTLPFFASTRHSFYSSASNVNNNRRQSVPLQMDSWQWKEEGDWPEYKPTDQWQCFREKSNESTVRSLPGVWLILNWWRESWLIKTLDAILGVWNDIHANLARKSDDACDVPYLRLSILWAAWRKYWLKARNLSLGQEGTFDQLTISVAFFRYAITLTHQNKQNIFLQKGETAKGR